MWDEIADTVEAAALAAVLARAAQVEALAMRWVPSRGAPALDAP